MSDHTPGPWRVEAARAWCEDAGGRFVISAGIHSPHGAPFAVAYLDADDADAHLIAAAPEMLEVVRGLALNHRHLTCDPHFAGVFERLVNMAKAVLVKAEGRE